MRAKRVVCDKAEAAADSPALRHFMHPHSWHRARPRSKSEFGNGAGKSQRRKKANLDTSRGRRVLATDASRPDETNGSSSSLSAVQRQSDACISHRRRRRINGCGSCPPRRVWGKCPFASRGAPSSQCSLIPPPKSQDGRF